MVRDQGIPCPMIYLTDVSRTAVPFAIRVMERINYTDLNQHNSTGQLDTSAIALEIGKFIARWKAITPDGFGLFDVKAFVDGGKLQGRSGERRVGKEGVSTS